MAITPWSWTSSNGTATDAQTRQAYAALTGKLLTVNFSYKVWNDLISKIYTVNYTLRRSWKTEYATYPNTRASGTYDTLTADKFNSARFNTNYPSWRWTYDEQHEGFIGRTDMRGIEQYGENGADVVYGVYILELVDRLNTVIGIINGTQDTVEMSESVPVIFMPETELIKASSQPFDNVRQRMRLRITPKLTSENLPTLTLRYRIPTALFRAILELESIASQLEGNIRQSVKFRGNLGNSNALILSQMILVGSAATAGLRTLPTGLLTSSGKQELVFNSRAHVFPAVASGGLTDIRSSISGNGTALKTTSIGWHHVRIIMEPDGTLVQERKQTAESRSAVILTADARFDHTQSAPIIFSGGAGTLIGNASLSIPETYSYVLHHDVSSVQHSAEVNLVTLMESMKASLLMYPLTARAVLEKEHVSTMLEAVLSSAVISAAEAEIMITGAMEKHIEIMLELPVILSGGNSVVLRWNIPISTEIRADAHAPQAARFGWQERIKLQAAAKANVPVSAPAKINQSVKFRLNGALTRNNGSQRFSAHGRNGHNAIGNLNRAVSSAFDENLDVALPTVSGNLDKYGLLAVGAESEMTHSHSAHLDNNSDIASINAAFFTSLSFDSDLGYVTYADMNAANDAFLILSADIENKGTGWQYPVIVDTDAAVFQVWLTEQCGSHIYLDPYEAVHHAEITNTASAGLDFVIRTEMEKAVDIHTAVAGEINTVRRSNWEYPVKTDNDIYVPQALYTRPAGQFKLEVL